MSRLTGDDFEWISSDCLLMHVEPCSTKNTNGDQRINSVMKVEPVWPHSSVGRATVIYSGGRRIPSRSKIFSLPRACGPHFLTRRG